MGFLQNKPLVNLDNNNSHLLPSFSVILSADIGNEFARWRAMAPEESDSSIAAKWSCDASRSRQSTEMNFNAATATSVHHHHHHHHNIAHIQPAFPDIIGKFAAASAVNNETQKQQ
ncbi:hypothetical protein OWV82_007634 [Melia azedarach]|uniref:Uncharacterized protein n=1 Tax=Melia azedarach TaxID=155640 RepID=A0ACC1Y8T4_MELAZ|nr:hypothetical protein OWV82_007634 [Melia azedarach]